MKSGQVPAEQSCIPLLPGYPPSAAFVGGSDGIPL